MKCEEAVWCNIVTGNSTLAVGLVYRSPNISMEENEKIHNAIKEATLQSTGREDQEFSKEIEYKIVSFLNMC